MKSVNHWLSLALIGVITVAAGFYSGYASVTAAPKAKSALTMPRQIVGYLSTNAAKLPPAKVEQSLWDLQRLWAQTQQKYQAQIDSEKMRRKLAKYSFRDLAQFRNIRDADVQQLLTNIYADGFQLINPEGMINLKINYAVIQPKITRYAPKAVAAYFKIISRSSLPNILVDGALKITPDALAERIVEAETFLNQNSGFTKKAEVSKIYKSCLAFYLLGANNTPAFKGNKLDKRFLQSYQAAAAKYQNTPFGKVIAEYLTILKQQQYQKTKPVLEFAKQKTA